jgi:hypothetical protein
MSRTIQRISLSFSCDIAFNEPVLNQLTVHLVTAGVSIEQFAGSRVWRTLLQSFNVRFVMMEGCVIGVGIPLLGPLGVRIAWHSAWEVA